MRIVCILSLPLFGIFSGCGDKNTATNKAAGTPSGPETPLGIPSVPHMDNEAKSTLEIVAFGDWGNGNERMKQAMATFNTKFPHPDAVFLLGDNYYSDYEAATFQLFTGHVAPPGTNRAHYVILGNHDHIHGLKKQLNYNKQDPRWILPSHYYFKRFKRLGFDVCVWFLDTEGIMKGDKAQISWLESSITENDPSCKWKLVNGHHPLMHASPILGQCPKPLIPIRTILAKTQVHMYLSGHHHNTQFMQHAPTQVYYAIAGGIMQLRGNPDPSKFPVVGRNYFWGTAKTTALLRLLVDAVSIKVEFHSGENPASPVLYSHTIS